MYMDEIRIMGSRGVKMHASYEDRAEKFRCICADLAHTARTQRIPIK